MSEAPQILGGGGVGRRGRLRGANPLDDPQTALYRALGYLPTPPWAGRALGEIIQRLDPGPWWAWEPACGEGHLAYALGDYFERVYATDIHDHGGWLQHGPPLDFLDPAAARAADVDWIITNPPYQDGLSARFVEVALQRARRGVAILQQPGFLESVGRFDLIYGAQPMTAFAQFSERVNMTLGGWDPEGSTATPYAWFIWMKPEALATSRLPMLREGGRGCWIGMGIPPGTRQRLTRPDDARRFGRAKPKQPRSMKGRAA